MTSYEQRRKPDPPEVHRSRRAVAQRLLEEAGVIAKREPRGSPLLYLPEDLWLRILSYLDIKTLLSECAPVCQTWLEIVYRLTGKHLSFTGMCKCKDCNWKMVLESKAISSIMRYLAKRVGSLESIGLDLHIIMEEDLERLCRILAACEKLTSVSISGKSYHRIKQLWEILPRGLTTLKLSDGDMDLKRLLQMDKLRELWINGRAVATLRDSAANKPDKILHKLRALTLHDVFYKQLPAPKMLGRLTQLSIQVEASSFFKGATSELVHFVMGLNKLRTLSINLGGVYIKSGASGDLRKLEKHPSLQGIRLSSDWEENAGRPQAVDVPLTKSLCSFFATQQLKVLNLVFEKHVEEPFRGVNFSASGLQQVALQFETDAPKLNISKLISAPNLEHLELQFPSISNLAELSLQVVPRRHNKPFRMTLVSSKIPKRWPGQTTLPLNWRTLEQGFGPQDYTNWKSVGAVLHQPLVRESDRKDKRIYCNQAYTAAARARTPRLAAPPQTCNFELLRNEEFLCEDCEDERADGEQRRQFADFCDRMCQPGWRSLFNECDSGNSECFSDSESDESSLEDSEEEYY